MVRDMIGAITDERLHSSVTRLEPDWPRREEFPVAECLRIVLNEEWEHRLYAERDLTALEASRPGAVRPGAAGPGAARVRSARVRSAWR